MTIEGPVGPGEGKVISGGDTGGDSSLVLPTLLSNRGETEIKDSTPHYWKWQGEGDRTGQNIYPASWLRPVYQGRELTWQLPRIAKDGDGDEEGNDPGSHEANPPGTNPQWAVSGQLCPVGRSRGPWITDQSPTSFPAHAWGAHSP